MSTSEIVADVISLSPNVNIPYFNKEGSYKGTILQYSMAGKIMSKNFAATLLSKNPELAEGLKKIQGGDKVKMVLVKKGDFTNVQSIEKVAADYVASRQPSISSSGKGGYDVSGQIKGNSITNAVHLAIASGDTSEDGIYKEALKVLAVHARLEGVDIKKLDSLDTGESVEVEAEPF
jgi:hypothetical protein